MRRNVLVSIVLTALATATLSACGSDAKSCAPAPKTVAALAATPVATPTSTPTASPAPTATPEAVTHTTMITSIVVNGSVPGSSFTASFPRAGADDIVNATPDSLDLATRDNTADNDGTYWNWDTLTFDPQGSEDDSYFYVTVYKPKVSTATFIRDNTKMYAPSGTTIDGQPATDSNPYASTDLFRDVFVAHNGYVYELWADVHVDPSILANFISSFHFTS